MIKQSILVDYREKMRVHKGLPKGSPVREQLGRELKELFKRIKDSEVENPTILSKKLGIVNFIDPLPCPPHKIKWTHGGEEHEEDVELSDIVGKLNSVIKIVNRLASKD